MLIPSPAQIKQIDQHTIAKNNFKPAQLMEIAAKAFVTKFCDLFPTITKIHIICGNGNNGGDGLAIARLLLEKKYDVHCYCFNNQGTEEFNINYNQLNKITAIKNTTDFLHIATQENAIIIDAIFGVGLNKKITNPDIINVIEKINLHKGEIIAVDIASGLFADACSYENIITTPTITISFQYPKLAFLLPENYPYVGTFYIENINLIDDNISQNEINYNYTEKITEEKRNPFSHKGTFGHGLLIAGNNLMQGAAVLSAKSAMRAGIGKLSLYKNNLSPEVFFNTIPEIIVEEEIYKVEKFDAIAIGPGIGTDIKNRDLLFTILQSNKPLILDADAINILSMHPELIDFLPVNCILTPHEKECKKLLNKNWCNDFEKIQMIQEFAIEKKVIICLKGRYTAVVNTDGNIYFNSTGNPGMATAGSGDVLTGIILANLAQGKTPLDAAKHGVYIHGKAGDLAAQLRSEKSIIASDIIDCIR